MKVKQALIAIGGKATRIRGAGIDVPVSKSFLRVNGQSLLYWNLLTLHSAGIRNLILCGNEPIQLSEAELLLGRLNVRFSKVTFFQDPGLGVHGLPYQVLRHAPDLLEETTIFECGHSLMTPNHYQDLASRRRLRSVAFSAFRPHPSNLRQPVRISRSHVQLTSPNKKALYALAHPMLIDHDYTESLPALKFDIRRIISHYAQARRLEFVFSQMPPEFDIPEEMKKNYKIYRSYLASTDKLPQTF